MAISNSNSNKKSKYLNTLGCSVLKFLPIYLFKLSPENSKWCIEETGTVFTK
jgi:hypothetical protein